jgi:hypothetical protein
LPQLITDEGILTREELFAEISAAAPEPGDIVYIERRGEDHAWKRTGLGTDMPMLGFRNGSRPDVWIYYAGQWPFGSESPERCRVFFSDSSTRWSQWLVVLTVVDGPSINPGRIDINGQP